MSVESTSVKNQIMESPGKNRSEWRAIGALFFLSILARAVAALVIGVSYPLDNDEPEFYEPAVHIAAGDGYWRSNPHSASHAPEPTAYRVPVPSMIIGAGFVIVRNESISAARLISAFISSFAAPLMYLLMRRTGMRPAAFLGGVVCAVYPSYVYFSIRIFSEPYFVPLLLLGLLATVWAIESPLKWLAIIAGIVWGLTGMVRPHGFPIAAMIALYLFARRDWKRGVLIAVGAGMVLSLWVARNQIVLGRPVLLATEAGETLLGANNPHVLTDPDGVGLWKSALIYPEYKSQLAGISNEVDRDKKLNMLALDYLRQNPGDIPRLVWNKLIAWLRPIPVSGGIVRLLVISSYDVLIVLLAIGLATRQIKRSLLLDLVLMSTFVFTLITCVYWGGLTRGRVPLEFLWIPWGAAIAWSLIERVMSRKSRTISDVSVG